MNFTRIMNVTANLLRKNSPAILTAFGVSGTITTTVLAVRSGMEHARILSPHENCTMSRKETAEMVWRVYIPPAVSAGVTIVCIVGAAKASSRRTAAITAAYSISERAFSEYREKVVEVIGKNKEQKVRDAIAQDKVNNNPPASIIATSEGKVLCCELFTGRYFESDMESLRKAENKINSTALANGEASLSDLYYLLGLPWTTYSSENGWTNERLLELEFSPIMAPGDKPCLAFDYSYIKPL
jgi:Family of unknown function (DUF6353)